MQAFTGMQLGKLILFVLMMSGGQVLFKLAAMRGPALSDLGSAFAMLTSGVTLAALALYGLATLLWIHLLQELPLSLAYPFVAAAFVIVPIAAFWLFREPISLRYLIGSGFIVVGIIIIAGRS